MQTLEVGDLRLIARVHQRLEAGLDQLAHAATEDDLLAEEVGLGFFAEGRLQHAGAGGADALGIGQRVRQRIARRVLMDGDQRRHARPFLEDFAHAVAGGLGRDHRHVHIGGRLDEAKADVEAVGKHERGPRLEVGRNVLGVDFGLHRVGQHHHDEVGFGGGLGVGHDPQPIGLGLGPALAALVQADAHIHAAVLEVERMRMALAAIADDGDLLALQPPQIRLIFVINLGHEPAVPSLSSLC